MDIYKIYLCPYCNDNIIIYDNELNCCIFRHAIDKITYKQINPHSTKEECDLLVKNNNVYGCCKPFKIINKEIYKCDYL